MLIPIIVLALGVIPCTTAIATATTTAITTAPATTAATGFLRRCI
jgi:hypothetical protein